MSAPMFTVAYCGFYNPSAPEGERICLAAVEGDTYQDARDQAELLGWHISDAIGINPDFCPDHKPEGS